MLTRLMLRLVVAISLGIAGGVAAAGVDEITVAARGDPGNGRLFVVFARDADEEPRFSIGWPVATTKASPFFAMDVEDWPDSGVIAFRPSAAYPLDDVEQLGEGRWYVQAVYDRNRVLSDVNSPGNLYSEVQAIEIDGDSAVIDLDLNAAEPAESVPDDRALLKFVRIRSKLLSEFYGEDIYLRASVLLPASHEPGSSERYPVLFHIGGLNARYTRSQDLIENEAFLEFWMAEATPPVVIVFVDGESPWGDSYQVNSRISGPYADANFTELFPYLATRFPIENRAEARFLSGCSTGGWVALALQLIYSDYFNGAWAFSPDSPTFKALQLVDLYADENAFTNEYGLSRPSMRQADGEPIFTIADEIASEAAMGYGDNFLYSGQQWGAWNAVYGHRDAAGKPVPIWDQVSGTIDRSAVEQWQSWDLDQYVRNNWAEIGSAVTGKLHFWMGDMDNFYLNVGLRIFEQTLAELNDPDPAAEFVWAPGRGHCDMDIDLAYADVIRQIAGRYRKAQP